VGLERGSLSHMSTTEELFERNNSDSGLENRKYSRGGPLRWPRDALYQKKLKLTSPTSGGRSVGIVRPRTKATEFNFYLINANGNAAVNSLELSTSWEATNCLVTLEFLIIPRNPKAYYRARNCPPPVCTLRQTSQSIRIENAVLK
jgi:hypothetical protein